MKFNLCNRLTRCTALFGLSALALMATNGSVRAEGVTTNLKVAIANTGRIFNDMQETKDLKAKLESRRQELASIEQDKRAKIKEMEDNLKNLKPDHPQYKKGLQDLDQAMADFESWGKVVRLEAERDQKQQMMSLFDKITSAVAQVAKNDGVDLVLADQASEIPNPEALNFDQLRALINQRDVLFASKKADISEEVLTVLDATYSKEKGAAGK